MTTVPLSPKYRLVNPRHVREALGLAAEQKIQVLQYGDRIEYIPMKPMRQMWGFLKGIDTRISRDKDRL